MRFEELRIKNQVRCESFHKINSWLPSQWSNAMAGECGEACNLTKKMDRLLSENPRLVIMNKDSDQNVRDLIERLGKEVADTVIYADLLMARVGLSLAEEVRKKFNEKSDEIGSDIKL